MPVCRRRFQVACMCACLLLAASVRADPEFAGDRTGRGGVVHEAGPAHDSVAAFLAGCAPIEDPPTDGFYRRRHFGNNPEMADRLLELIVAGEKTVTFNTPWLYEGDRHATPVPGGYTVVTDFRGRPRVLLRTTSAETLPFHAITEEHSQYEGPGARPLDAWRQIHRTFWEPALARRGKTFDDDMPVTVERFEVVCSSQ